MGGRGDRLKGPRSYNSVADVRFSPSGVRGAVRALEKEEGLSPGRKGCLSRYQCDDRVRASVFSLQGQGRSARQGAPVPAYESGHKGPRFRAPTAGCASAAKWGAGHTGRSGGEGKSTKLTKFRHPGASALLLGHHPPKRRALRVREASALGSLQAAPVYPRTHQVHKSATPVGSVLATTALSVHLCAPGKRLRAPCSTPVPGPGPAASRSSQSRRPSRSLAIPRPSVQVLTDNTTVM
ncbi:hypothetical protein NDU88_002401 [Pleurodeles waltl]|uniref:Uncharacterized protein n=1 Tax=Pleurodeles waltl TaxID=8319 RepID=A0AAV7KYV2_PLEWA|nr:hypothetical protein NDU88_002401 [Pleurodeles waltl]